MTMQRSTPAAALAALLALSLAACSGGSGTAAPETAGTPDAGTTAPATEDAAPVADETSPGELECNADAVQSLVGQEATDDIAEQAKTDSGASIIRVLKPGEAATMDYRVERLNIMLDDAGKIESLHCG